MTRAHAALVTALLTLLASMPAALRGQQPADSAAVVQAALGYLRDTRRIERLVVDSVSFRPTAYYDQVLSAVRAARAGTEPLVRCSAPRPLGTCVFLTEIDAIVTHLPDRLVIRERSAETDLVLTWRRSPPDSVTSAAVFRISLVADSAGGWSGNRLQMIAQP